MFRKNKIIVSLIVIILITSIFALTNNTRAQLSRFQSTKPVRSGNYNNNSARGQAASNQMSRMEEERIAQRVRQGLEAYINERLEQNNQVLNQQLLETGINIQEDVSRLIGNSGVGNNMTCSAETPRINEGADQTCQNQGKFCVTYLRYVTTKVFKTNEHYEPCDPTQYHYDKTPSIGLMDCNMGTPMRVNDPECEEKGYANEETYFNDTILCCQFTP